MICSIKTIKYKNLNAFKLENDIIRIVVVPDLGAKITSMLIKKSNKEFLYQLNNENLKQVGYGGDYLKSEMCGFDDMFPTISEYHYEQFPWTGAKIPDHGEVWSLKWNSHIENSSVNLEVYGVRLPYVLRKIISLEDNTIHINYEVTNPTSFDMDFLWSGHIMLNAEAGCRHIPPRGNSKAVCTYSESGLIGAYGQEFDFPKVKQADGSIYDAGLHRGNKANDFQKFYFNNVLNEGNYSLIYPDGHQFTVCFPFDKIPYIAGINAEGGSFNVECAYIEPCTAPFDRPDVARLHNKCSVLKAKSGFTWELIIKLK